MNTVACTPPLRLRPAARWCHVALLTFAACLFTVRAATVNHDIAAGNFIITTLFNVDNNSNATNTLGLSINDYRAGTYNRADLNVQIGPSDADDVVNGILLTAINENGRNNYGTNGYAVSVIDDTTRFRIATFVPNVAGSAGSSVEYNVNVAGAWFPYTKYLGGVVRNGARANTGSNDTLVASSSLILGVHVQPQGTTNALAAASFTGGGRTIVDLTSLGIDSRTDGVLLVNGGKDEANFALSQVDVTNGGWIIYCHDNATANANGYEQDPVAFVYIPRTNTAVVSGRFAADAGGTPTIEMYSGASPQFTVTPQGAGRWYLQMNNYAATNGILIISAEGGGTYNLDNIVNYQMTGDGLGWQIQTRDTPNNGLQTPYNIVNGESVPGPVASFVFVPAPTPGFTVTPTNNLLTTEAGGTAQFSVALHFKPTANVTIAVTSSDPTEGTPSVSTLTFTPANWNVPQIVTVTGQDDLDLDGQIAYTIQLAAAVSTDPGYNGLNPADVTALNADSEAGITVSKSVVTTTEAGDSDSFTIVLNTAPTDSVTIALTSNDTSEGTVAPPSVTFTTGDWSVPQLVTITGVSDAVADGNVAYSIVTAAATSTDGTYNGFNASDVAAVNLDNDTASLVVSQSAGLIVAESGSATNFTVALSSEPTANVTVNIASADTTEGTVAPASRTFTPVNWATPQSFTLTGANDATNDGNINYNLNVTVTSGDAPYAALTTTLAATTIDNEAQLTFPSGPLQYAISLPGVAIDPAATVVDETLDYNGGSLTVTLTANGTSVDRLGIRNIGNNPGEIGVSGATVSYGGTPIGTFTGGVGLTPLVVSLNLASGPAAAEALIRAITFHAVSATPSIATRTITFALADGDGGTSTAATQAQVGLLHTSDFQNGRDAGFGTYTNTADCELNSTFPDAAYPQGSSPLGIRIHTQTAGSPFPDVNALLRFDQIIGSNPGQIPPGAQIVSADLYLNITDSGDGSPLFRMLVPWNAESESWNSLGSGVDIDNVEATNVWYSQINVTNLSQATGLGLIKVGVVPDIQAWANGDANYGWVLPCWFMNNSATRDLTIFSQSEAATAALRPRLVVKWVPAGTASASFRQGVNSYTGTKDTRIREGAPGTAAAATVNLFVDGEVTSGAEDPEQVFVRFDNIIGTSPGQVPPGATIHAAALDLSSTIGNAAGNGGKVHRMLRTWVDTDTWNTLVGGIDADNIEAASVPTATTGDVELEETVQGAYHTFTVTPDVQAWANGSANNGWALLPWPYGGDGWGITSSEATVESDRPRLRIFYTSNYVATIVLKTPVVSPGSVLINFSGTPNTLHYILRAPAITGPWTTNGTATTGLNGNGVHTDAAPLPGAAFYRGYLP